MTIQISPMASVIPAPRTVRRAPWSWAAPAALAAAGGVHLIWASSLGDDGLLQMGVVLSALGQLAAASFLVGLLIAGLVPPRWMVVLLMAGTTALAVVDVLAHTTDLLPGGTLVLAPDGATDASLHGTAGHGFLGAAAVAAEVLLVMSLARLLPAGWRRRTTDLLLGLGALLWGLWLIGLLG